jgi:signal transduction histidine kinase
MRNDSRAVLVAYATLTWGAGFIVFSWPGFFLSPSQYDLGGMYLGRMALWRIAGAGVMAFGCFASALISVDDPHLRRNGLVWLAGAHGIISLALFTQVAGPWGPGTGEKVAQVFGILALVLTGAAALQSRFQQAKSLHSRYEQQIRLAARQEERNRLARDLHDSIKQQIFAIHTSTATAQERFDRDPAGAKEALDLVRGSAREAITEMEAMLDQLRATPLENAGLIEALKKQCEALGFRTGAKVDFRAGVLPPNECLPPGAQQAIFRVAQEALSNVARHARAKNVSVSLDSCDGPAESGPEAHYLELKVEDDGVGFQPDSRGGMGIANMQARAEEFAGKFDQVNRPGNGASVRFSIPLVHERPNSYSLAYVWWGAMLVLSLFVMSSDPSYSGPVVVLVAVGAGFGIHRYFRARKQRAGAA